MSLGLLAKDSIQDLEALAREATKDENTYYTNNYPDHEEQTTTTIATENTSNPGLFLEDTDEGTAPADGSIAMSVPSMEPIETVESSGTSSSDTDNENLAASSPSAKGSGTVTEAQRRPTTGHESGKDEDGQATNYGIYSEFSSAYYDPYLYSDELAAFTYAPPIMDGKRSPNGFWQSLLPCIFPWTSPSDPALPLSEMESNGHNTIPQENSEKSSESADLKQTANGLNGEHAVSVSSNENKKPLQRSSSLGESDDISTGSDGLGEKMSDKERNAMLARLGFPPPEAEEAEEGEADDAPPKKNKNKRGLLNDVQQYDPSSGLDQNGNPLNKKPKIRGILKCGSVVASSNTAQQKDNSTGQLSKSSTKTKSNPHRRSLFPQAAYVSASMNAKKTNAKSVSFAPMARVVTVKSKNDMDATEKAAIWWQKADYDDFRKTGRIITKAMLEGGSELWLSSERCTGRKGGLKGKAKENKGDADTGGQDIITATGDKWWHKFGHSRRGLEHVVSVEEGKQRQLNVRCAIRAVIDEQYRLAMYPRTDPEEKLRMVSLQYTSWARDLALASGSSDADAVSSSFSNERKTREFFLSRMSSGSTAGSSVVPEFMQQSFNITTPHRLDANTSAQLRFRRQTQQQHNQQQHQTSPSTSVRSTTDAQNSLSAKTELSEPVHDHQNGDSSMARRAAGFTAGHNGQRVDMSAVLSGMGAVPRSSQVLSSRA